MGQTEYVGTARTVAVGATEAVSERTYSSDPRASGAQTTHAATQAS